VQERENATMKKRTVISAASRSHSAELLERQRFASGLKRSFDQMIRVADGKEKGKDIRGLIQTVREEMVEDDRAHEGD
jgi:hypothetical protein